MMVYFVIYDVHEFLHEFLQEMSDRKSAGTSGGSNCFVYLMLCSFEADMTLVLIF